MKTADFSFHLPEELIAKRPCQRRDDSRLLVLNPDGTLEHRTFRELPSYLKQGDMLLINNTRVFPAHLTGRKPTGGRLQLLMTEEVSGGLWNVLCRERYSGRIRIAEDLSAEVIEGRQVRFDPQTDVMALLWKYGSMPLPPYIRRHPDKSDRETYQTVYAEVEGSIAAPTAGLHFTPELLEALRLRGVRIESLTLHVGIGTFRPVRAEQIEEHRMESENFAVRAELIHDIEEAKQKGRRIFAVGTTTTRAIEGCLSGKSRVFSANGTINGSTDIFIHEGYQFRAIDALITNFHLPCSTPLMLTAAFAGREKLLNAYDSAIASKYRFFSYGDAMLVL